MSGDLAVSQHYRHGNLLGAIEGAVEKLGRSVDTVTVEDLGPVDEFHIGGRAATENLLNQLDISRRDYVLDVGCGLGGAARLVASKYSCHVTGIDLVPEFIETGVVLTSWVKLDRRVTLRQGSALSLPFEGESFTRALVLHVGMNVEDKKRLFGEVSRVLCPGGLLGLYDIMRTGAGEPAYPVPWATDAGMSHLSTREEYGALLADAGFTIEQAADRRAFAVEFFGALKARTQASGGPAPLGLHTLMKESTPVKIANMMAGIVSGVIAPVEIVARKG